MGVLKHYLFIHLITLLISAIPLQAQINGKITGRVLDERTGAPLNDANVYIVNTTLGAPTNNSGRYLIENISPGRYTMIVSMVGYGRRHFQVTIEKNKTTRLNIDLKKRAIALPEITVNSHDQWQEYYEIFFTELIGESSFAGKCEILNPEVINFELDDDDYLWAKTDSFITIVNGSLGYKIKLLLKTFKWDTDTDIGTYSVYPYFSELTPSSQEQFLEWQNNRQRAFLGSFRHFLRAVAQDSLFTTNYAVYRGSVADFTFRKSEKVERKHWDIRYEPEYATVCMNQPYMVENGYLDEMKDLKTTLNKNCVIVPAECLIINYDGVLLNPDKVQVSGYWANQRMAEALPYNYRYR